MKTSDRLAIFPGQFDPITRGHLDLIRRGAELYDRLIVAVGVNPDKRELFTLDERVDMIRDVTSDLHNVEVRSYSGLTMDFVKSVGAAVILRGLRDASDVRYEFQLALANRAVGGVETVFIMTGEPFALTSSSLIRQVVMLGGELKQLFPVVPESVIDRLERVRYRLAKPEADTPTS
jgi:pantetheine-phosphate adenylyltransferase